MKFNFLKSFSKFLEPLKQITKKVESKGLYYSVELNNQIKEINAAFDDIKEWTQTVVNKIDLDAQIETKVHDSSEVLAHDDGSHGAINILGGIGNWIKKAYEGLSNKISESNDNIEPINDAMYAEVFIRVFKEKFKKLLTVNYFASFN